MARVLSAAALAAVAVLSLSCGADPPSPEVFTPARATFGQAVRDFYRIRPEPRQPIEFPHNIHVSKDLTCTDFCHATVTMGPEAGLPSLNTCMVCHQAIATDKPRIMEIAAMAEKGLDLQWQRVYGYPNESHVRFNHAPHIRAGVDCASCHGDVASQTVATRNVNQNMGFCVSCHKERSAPNECVTCHF
jgi:hypothetical protein